MQFIIYIKQRNPIPNNRHPRVLPHQLQSTTLKNQPVVALFSPGASVSLKAPTHSDRIRIALGVSKHDVDIPRNASIVHTTTLLNAAVPGLYTASDLRTFNSYHVYLIRVSNVHNCPTSYAAPIDRNVDIRARAPGLTALQHGIVRLCVSSRPLSYLAYSTGNGYRLRAITKRINLHRIHCNCRNSGRLTSIGSTSGPCFSCSPDGYVIYGHYIHTYRRARNAFTLAVAKHNFRSQVTTTNNSGFLSSRYISYNTYIRTYPATALVRGDIIRLNRPRRDIVAAYTCYNINYSFHTRVGNSRLIHVIPSGGNRTGRNRSYIGNQFT